MHRMRFISLLFAVLLSIFICFSASAEESRKNFILGMSAAFTGPSKGLGIELYRGAQAYFNQVNARGGVNGRKIVIQYYDDGYNPLPAIRNTIRLVERDEVTCLFNYVGTPTVTRVLPVIKHFNAQKPVYLFFHLPGLSRNGSFRMRNTFSTFALPTVRKHGGWFTIFI